MKRAAAVRVALQWAIGMALWMATPAHAESRLLLVVSVDSPVQELNSVQVQRLFLGLAVVVGDRRLHAVRNESDELMQRVFFQNIVFLSEAAYDRRMLALTMQQGTKAPPVVRSTAALLEVLGADPDAVSFAWARDIDPDARVKILRILWRE